MSGQPRGPLRVTISDIADEAGVSRATATRALQGKGRFSEETRARILEISERLGYVPNLGAAELAAGRTGAVGLMLRDASNPVYGLLFSQLQEAAQARDMELITVTIGADAGGHGQVQALRRLLGMRVAGLIVATGGVSTAQLTPFADEVPIIRAGRAETGDRIHAISYDEHAHGTALAEHVLRLGHRRVAVLATDPEKSFPEHLRATAMQEALTAGGADVTVVAAGSAPDSGVPALVDLARAGAVSAVMCPSDTRQLEFLRAARAAGLSVPGDVSVTGCDGILPGVDLLGLTTVRVPVEDVARAVVDSMDRLLTEGEGRDVVRRTIAGTLLPGATAAAVDGAAAAHFPTSSL
jgi:DNA-binding LacI/PurR family transcriptional regulator